MSVNSYEELIKHKKHKIVVDTFGKRNCKPVNVAIHYMRNLSRNSVGF